MMENLRISFRAIRSNKVRTILTICIIAFGIMALVGILTAIDAIKTSLTDQFTLMGANSFSITSRGLNVQIGETRHRSKNFSYISYKEASEFKSRFREPAWVSISFNASGMATVKYGSETTDPNISLVGVDENYLSVAGYELASGRNFSPEELEFSRRIVLLGSDVADNLFSPGINPLGKEISVAGLKLRVTGILKSKGASITSTDGICFMPVTTARQYFSRPDMNYRIDIMPINPANLDILTGQAEAIFRVVRNLDPRDESDFNITKSDSIVELLLRNIKFITLAATIIGLVTLFGAAIGLMNIMLVSVRERTREIGVRKAIGAKPGTIRNQFLFESIMIGQLGGICGIVLGILAGNVVSSLLNSSFVVPWLWVFVGIVLCFLVGVVSGYAPALKAAGIDPIEALRYE
ncbi:MAG: FtsX-like permease family protein [Bacteroidetes bacterium]|nr:FtsX-like permease family protein [Bacteroidota bacterium]